MKSSHFTNITNIGMFLPKKFQISRKVNKLNICLICWWLDLLWNKTFRFRRDTRSARSPLWLYRNLEFPIHEQKLYPFPYQHSLPVVKIMPWHRNYNWREGVLQMSINPPLFNSVLDPTGRIYLTFTSGGKSRGILKGTG